MTTQIEDVIDPVGLLIDGDVVAGGEGTYPVTNPARPAEVVLDAPSTSPAQLDLAVAAARRSQPAWAALASDDRAALVIAAAEAGVAAVEAHDLARLLTREHGKTHLESIFDTAAMGGMAAAFAPVVAEALAPRDLSGGATRIEWVPHGVVAAVLPFNWPVSVMGNKVLPALLAGDAVVVKTPPTCPAWCSSWRPPWPRSSRRASSAWSTDPLPRSARRWSPTRASTWSPSPVGSSPAGR